MKKIIVIFLMLLHSAVWAMESVEQGIRLFNQKEYCQRSPKTDPLLA
ncbi:hypothetical protein Q9L41_15880 [Vibrio cholerae]|nr:hypothetical protein [Vibrio cholerae]MDP4497290.1 hypothetical protein [Vibrio cholerae]